MLRGAALVLGCAAVMVHAFGGAGAGQNSTKKPSKASNGRGDQGGALAQASRAHARTAVTVSVCIADTRGRYANRVRPSANLALPLRAGSLECLFATPRPRMKQLATQLQGYELPRHAAGPGHVITDENTATPGSYSVLMHSRHCAEDTPTHSRRLLFKTT